jgi:hypothetical protein
MVVGAVVRVEDQASNVVPHPIGYRIVAVSVADTGRGK